MKKMILSAMIVLFTSCTAEPIEQPKATSVALCGNVFSVQTLFTYPASVFIGVRYDIILTPPYDDGTTTWTKAYFIINDAQNTPLVQQYWTSPPTNYCGNIPVVNLYN